MREAEIRTKWLLKRFMSSSGLRRANYHVKLTQSHSKAETPSDSKIYIKIGHVSLHFKGLPIAVINIE